MEIKIKYEDLAYQREAIASVVGIFKDITLGSRSIIDPKNNKFSKSDLAKLYKNIHEIQGRNSITLSPQSEIDNKEFAVEMETGTGKTYVYLSAAIEIFKNTGHNKFVILVPSLAVRQGVDHTLKNLQNHFTIKYKERYNATVYNTPNDAIQFAEDGGLHFLILNTQQFNIKKEKKGERKFTDNHHELSRGFAPIEWVAATQPILILDEPQTTESTNQQFESNNKLNPLIKLYFSATHRKQLPTLYRLNAYDAYRLNLVKRTEVIALEPESTDPQLFKKKLIEETFYAHRRKKAEFKNKNIKAKVISLFFVDDIKKIDEQYKNIIKELGICGKAIGVYVTKVDNEEKVEVEINRILKDKEEYLRKDSKIEFIFTHSKLREGWDNPNIFQLCILRNNFIDKKSHIRVRQEIGRGLRLAVDYNGQRLPNMEHNKLTLIVPTSFSAFTTQFQQELSEDIGYSIATATLKIENLFGITKPISAQNSINYFTQYDAAKVFVGLKDAENIEEDGKFTNQLIIKLAKKEFIDLCEPYNIEEIKKQVSVLLTRILGKYPIPQSKNIKKYPPKFNHDHKRLWKAINQQTYFEYKDPISLPTELTFNPTGSSVYRFEIILTQSSPEYNPLDYGNNATILPDIVTAIEKNTSLTRKEVINCIAKLDPSTNLADIIAHPSAFVEQISETILDSIWKGQINKVEYKKISKEYPLTKFERLSVSDSDLVVKSRKTPYGLVICDSQVEQEFAEKLNSIRSVKAFIKLPRWFKVSTPMGGYAPDWAILFTTNHFAIIETKSSVSSLKLRPIEELKTQYAQRHFEAIKVSYEVYDNIDSILDFKKFHRLPLDLSIRRKRKRRSKSEIILARVKDKKKRNRRNKASRLKHIR